MFCIFLRSFVFASKTFNVNWNENDILVLLHLPANILNLLNFEKLCIHLQKSTILLQNVKFFRGMKNFCVKL